MAHRYGLIEGLQPVVPSGLGVTAFVGEEATATTVEGFTVIFGGGGGGGFSQLRLLLKLLLLLLAGGFLTGGCLKGDLQSSESSELLLESLSESESLLSSLSLSLLESSELLRSVPLSDAALSTSFRYRSERRISRTWNGSNRAVLIG